MPQLQPHIPCILNIPSLFSCLGKVKRNWWRDNWNYYEFLLFLIRNNGYIYELGSKQVWVKEVFGDGNSFTYIFNARISDNKLYLELKHVFCFKPHFQRTSGVFKCDDFSFCFCNIRLYRKTSYLFLCWTHWSLYGSRRFVWSSSFRVHYIRIFL